ncbi:MAG: sigma 54-interacting transcriptional regulator [Candidatus Wallbacteria bacterium]
MNQSRIKNIFSLDGRQVIDYFTDGIFTVDRNFQITSFNKAAEKITGIKADNAHGLKCSKIFNTDICGIMCPLKKALKTGEKVEGIKLTITSGAGKKIPISITTGPLYDDSGSIIGGIEIFKDVSNIETLKKQLLDKYSQFDIIGQSDYFKNLFEIMPDIAESNCNVLIEGPSGSGKSFIARAIHNISRRSSGPFITVNCGALPENLLESELFGYVKGAFTDAKTDKPGRFALAAGGTIFLDEIAEMPLHLQVKLLRVIEEKCYEPLGGIKTVKADVRIIAATNRDIKMMIKKGKFREDLYYRLKIVNLKLPSLRERRDDIPLLADYFINKLNVKYSKNISLISEELYQFFASYDFPGNVRELQNILEYACIFCKGDTLSIKHLSSEYKDYLDNYKQSHIEISEEMKDLKAAKNITEKQSIINALAKFSGKRTMASEFLGIDKATLWRKMKKYGLL